MANSRTRGTTHKLVVPNKNTINRIELRNIDKENGTIKMNRKTYNQIVQFIKNKKTQAVMFKNSILQQGLSDIEDRSSNPVARGQCNLPFYDLGIIATRLFCFHYDIANHYEGVSYKIIVTRK